MVTRTMLVTFVLFYVINFGGWEVFVAKGMNETWSSFTAYIVLIVVVVLI